MKEINIYTDGAASMKQIDEKYIRGNGGAAIAVVENDNIIFYDSKGFNKTTNNYCELYGIYMALKYFTKHYPKEYKLNIYSDSAYCVNMLKENGWIYSWYKNKWTRGKKHEPIENLDIIKDIWEFIQSINVSFIKVKGHDVNKFNIFVDKLAVLAKKNMIDKTKCIQCKCKTCDIAESNGGSPGCSNCEKCREENWKVVKSCNDYYNSNDFLI